MPELRASVLGVVILLLHADAHRRAVSAWRIRRHGATTVLQPPAYLLLGRRLVPWLGSRALVEVLSVESAAIYTQIVSVIVSFYVARNVHANSARKIRIEPVATHKDDVAATRAWIIDIAAGTRQNLEILRDMRASERPFRCWNALRPEIIQVATGGKGITRTGKGRAFRASPHVFTRCRKI